MFTKSLRIGSAVAAASLALAVPTPTFCAPNLSVTTVPGQKSVKMGRYVITSPVPGVAGQVIRTGSISAVKYRTLISGKKVMFRFACTHDSRLPMGVSDFRQIQSEIVKTSDRMDELFHTRTTYLAPPTIAFRGFPAYTTHSLYIDGNHFSDTESLEFLAAGDVYSVSCSITTKDKPPTRVALAEADRHWRTMIRHIH